MAIDADTERLLAAIRALSQARTNEEVHDIVKKAARALVHADGATFVLRDDGHCFYVDEDAIAPMWKGMRFPLSQCVSGWAMTHKESVVIPDILVDDRVPQEAYRDTFVKSLAMVPIRQRNPIGAIGVYWADRHEPTEQEVALVQSLADTTSVILENVEIIEQLEARVLERTAELDFAYQRIKKLADTDQLTGLLNRRGFYEVAAEELERSYASGRSALLAFLDMDGLKQINDELGHEAGSAALSEIAEAIRSCFRGGDVVGRVGGDEFAVLATNPSTLRSLHSQQPLVERIESEVARRNNEGDRLYHLSVSIGVVFAQPGQTVEELMMEADRFMYQVKRSRRGIPASPVLEQQPQRQQFQQQQPPRQEFERQQPPPQTQER